MLLMYSIFDASTAKIYLPLSVSSSNSSILDKTNPLSSYTADSLTKKDSRLTSTISLLRSASVYISWIFLISNLFFKDPIYLKFLLKFLTFILLLHKTLLDSSIPVGGSINSYAYLYSS